MVETCDIRIQDVVERLASMDILEPLLRDRTTGGHIRWATSSYADLGNGFGKDDEVSALFLTDGSFTLKSRVEKNAEIKQRRTKKRAEVFTPISVVRQMNDYVEDAWFGREDSFYVSRVEFPSYDGRGWTDFVESTRLEITCGEAPYLTTRYDVATGESIPVSDRCGMLDRKLRVVSENSTDEDFMGWTFRALKATYGYEISGDNLLIARINVLNTFEEHVIRRLGRGPSKEEYDTALDIITWNLWQMDGIKMTVPVSDKPALIRDWGNGQTTAFQSIGK